VVLRKLTCLGAGVSREDKPLVEAAILRWALQPGVQPETLVGMVQERRRRAVESLSAHGGHCAATITFRPTWRAVVGLHGGASPHEVALALHGTYGFPVIPATAIKGAAAHYAREAEAEGWEDVFGGPRPRRRGRDQQGSVVFLDAIPAGRPATLVHDVMTPHVGPYYENPRKNAPAEWWQPVPVDFLALDATSEFQLDLIGRNPRDLDLAVHWVVGALKDRGIGAKTSAGYGYANVTSVDAPTRVAGGEP